MRHPTPREILLQNLLATSSTLLFRAARALEVSTFSEREALVIETEEWFAETEATIAAAIAEDAAYREPPGQPLRRKEDTPWVPPPSPPIIAIPANLAYFLK